MKFNLVRRDNDANLTAFIGDEMYVADEAHVDFENLVAAALADDDEKFLSLFDSSIKAAAVFENLTDRVKVENSRVYVDGFEVVDAYADTLVAFLGDDTSDEDRNALVNFLEKVYSNVSEEIREHLSRWLKAEEFTILPNGNILGYRGLTTDYKSKHAGPGIVNGVRVNGHLDNSVGNVVEIDANLVEANARVGCASGLHVGTFAYAKSWAGGGALVSVEVDPRHVRSVPYECSDSKMRVSKYTVLSDVTDKASTAVSYDYDVDDTDEFGDDDVSADYVEGYVDGYGDAATGYTAQY